MEVLLDTNFVISCLLKKIDFLDTLNEMGFTPVIPREVMQELKDLRNKDKTSHEERIAIDLLMQIIEKEKIKKMSLGNNNVDSALIEKGKQGIYIATLDNGIKRKIKNKIVIDNANKSLRVLRS